MGLIKQEKLQDGLHWIEVPGEDLRILCGCPEDAIKHLSKAGKLVPQERDGVRFESGPNCILLSDLPMQNGRMCNLSEFPILHYLYKQGQLIPGHPNYHLPKPILIGNREEIRKQEEYIFRGNYGLASPQEYQKIGTSPQQAREFIRIKLRFAFGEFVPSRELVDLVVLGTQSRTIRGACKIRRKATNLFVISYKGEEVEVNLNLEPGQDYHPTFHLPQVAAADHEFAVVHLGEGDGWDPHRGCLSSMIIRRDKRFVLDMGPNLKTILEAFAMEPQDLDGIFVTHAHDDHFAGIFSLIPTRGKLKLFATKEVFETVALKLCALTGWDRTQMHKKVKHHELKLEEWNQVAGMRVMPFFSPHPVDTTCFRFEVKSPQGPISYGHFSDISPLKTLRKMIQPETEIMGISQEQYQHYEAVYQQPCSLKKVDVGGAPVHGDANDYLKDQSDTLILAHTTRPLEPWQLKIGQQAEFGEIHILIP